ncbi:MAG: M1 family aminopeptidase [Candidatus Zixiibacteriota bacterium]
MIFRRIVLFSFLFLFIGPHTHCQYFKNKSDALSSFLPKALYTIKAEIIPDSSLVRAELELQYTNYSEDTLKEIYFHLALNSTGPNSYMEQRYLQVEDSSIYKLAADERGYCRIDSILYLGVPLKYDQLLYDNTILKINLPKAIYQGETGFFLIAFEAKLPRHSLDDSHLLQFTNWYPQVCVYKNGLWYNQQQMGWNDSYSEFANYNVELIIDSLYSIAHCGNLINEKEHYGLLPEADSDTIYIDYINKASQNLDSGKYQPLFKDGIKHYFIKETKAANFSFLVGDNFNRDLTGANQLAIEVCYNDNTKINWSHHVAETSQLLVREFEKYLGRFPYNHLTIAPSNIIDISVPSQSLIIIPVSIKDKKTLKAFLAVELASCWFSPSLSTTNVVEQFFDEGIAYYTAITLLYDLFGIDGYKMIKKYEKFIKKKSSLYKLFKKDKKFLNPYKKEIIIENKLIAQDIRLLQKFPVYRFRKYPAELYMLRFVMGEDNLREAIQIFIEKYRYNFTCKKDFEMIVNKTTDNKYNWFFSRWNDNENYFDYSLTDVKTEKNEQLYNISYKLFNEGNIIMPVEIAFVTGTSDTTYDTLSYSELISNNDDWHFNITLGHPPVAIVIDPNHYLMDINRFNNYYFKMPIRYRYISPKNLFIGFDNK